MADVNEAPSSVIDWNYTLYESQKAIPIWGACVYAGESWNNGDYGYYFLWGGIGLIEGLTFGELGPILRNSLFSYNMFRVTSKGLIVTFGKTPNQSF